MNGPGDYPLHMPIVGGLAIDIVHILHGGLPLCGFSEGATPHDWPGGHRWVSKTEAGATCPSCKHKLMMEIGAEGTVAMNQLQKFDVFSVRQTKPNAATIWVKVGFARANRDGSINVTLDALPIDGKLHLRLPPKDGG